jgi:C4-dicarboxylate transporter DctQ subunit
MLKILDRLEDTFVVITFFFATLLVFINVVLRFFGVGTTWSEELIRYLIIWLTFIGGSICVRKGEHVGIDLLPELLSTNLKRILFIIVNLIAIIFLAFVLKFSIELIQFNIATGQIAPALGVPMYIVYFCVPIGSMLMIVRHINVIVNICKGQVNHTQNDMNLKG